MGAYLQAVVIGAGVVGAAVAAGLARRGAQVTVLESGEPGRGTTRTSFAWVNSANKEPESYFRLNHAGMRAHREFAGEGAPWFFPTGNLEWAVDEEHSSALHSRVEKLRARDYAACWLTAEQAHALEPDLREQPRGAEYAFFREEAHVFPLMLLARMLGEARDRGARIVHSAHVSEIDPASGSVRTADGGRYSADVVVSCTGRWTATVASAAGAQVPMLDPDLPGSATVGFLATTVPLPVRLSRVLTTPQLNIRPDGAGRLMLQALDLDAVADPAEAVAPDCELARKFAERLRGVLAIAESPSLEKVVVGQRAIPADGRTVAGFTEERFYVVATHSGVTLAPLLGTLVADEIFGTESVALADFRPGRAATGVPSPPRRPGEQ